MKSSIFWDIMLCTIENQLMLGRNMSPPCSLKTSGGLSTDYMVLYPRRYEQRTQEQLGNPSKENTYLTCTCLLIMVGGGLGGCMRFEKSGGTD
jgi:hypothetical protein